MPNNNNCNILNNLWSLHSRIFHDIKHMKNSFSTTICSFEYIHYNARTFIHAIAIEQFQALLNLNLMWCGYPFCQVKLPYPDDQIKQRFLITIYGLTKWLKYLPCATGYYKLLLLPNLLPLLSPNHVIKVLLVQVTSMLLLPMPINMFLLLLQLLPLLCTIFMLIVHPFSYFSTSCLNVSFIIVLQPPCSS